MDGRTYDGSAFAIYPMVEERAATGRVARVYGDVLARMPMVPSLFKSLAVCPPYLELAWAQARDALDSNQFAVATEAVIGSAGGATDPVAHEDVRDALGAFIEPLGRMLLVAAGLRLALDDRLEGTPASPLELETPDPGDLDGAAPAQWEVDAADRFGEIRHALRTPIVNSIWRSLAGEGLLEAAWSELRPQVRTTLDAADRPYRAALDRAEVLRWSYTANPRALAAAGISDAAPGISTILEAYLLTLARVLTLVAP